MKESIKRRRLSATEEEQLLKTMLDHGHPDFEVEAVRIGKLHMQDADGSVLMLAYEAEYGSCLDW